MISVLVSIICRAKAEDELCCVVVSGGLHCLDHAYLSHSLTDRVDTALYEVSRNSQGSMLLSRSSLGLVFVLSRILTNSVRHAPCCSSLTDFVTRMKREL